MMNPLRPVITILLLLTLVTGVAYPLLTTALGEALFPRQASGSLIDVQGQLRGSTLIGQHFTRPGYFHGRPSATADAPYNPLASSGSNLGPTNPALLAAVTQRVAALKAENPQASGPVPVDLVTASGSGLDPHISPVAARWQAPRVAAARQLPLADVERLIAEHTVTPLPYYIGEAGVNVVQLNLALDALQQ